MSSSGGGGDVVGLGSRTVSGAFERMNRSLLDDERDETPLTTYLQAYFIVIAMVLGTGILALPIRLAESGFAPFCVMYFFCAIFQILIVFFMVEVLQQAAAREEPHVPQPNPMEIQSESTDVESEGGTKRRRRGSDSSYSVDLNSEHSEEGGAEDGVAADPGTSEAQPTVDADGSSNNASTNVDAGGASTGPTLALDEQQEEEEMSVGENGEERSATAVHSAGSGTRPTTGVGAVSGRGSGSYSPSSPTTSDFESSSGGGSGGGGGGSRRRNKQLVGLSGVSITVDPAGGVGGGPDANVADDLALIVAHDPSAPEPPPAAAADQLPEHDGPDLHGIGKLFLPGWMQPMFDAAVMVHFISLLISYLLAGSQAYAQLFGISEKYRLMIPIFWAFFTAIIVWGSKVVTPVVSMLTFFKGALLVAMVFIVGYVGQHVQQKSDSDWAKIGQPFLISTIALGGAVNILPVVFAKIERKKAAVQNFRVACVAALCTVAVLTLLWCLFLLQIIPQQGKAPSLESARKEGQISTVPLVDVINERYSAYGWIATCVETFIIVSITVSYLTMGTGMKHTLDGVVFAINRKQDGSATARSRLARCHPALAQPLVQTYGLYAVSFLFVFGVAVLNPKSFLAVLEIVGSFALNLETGVFICVMLHVSHDLGGAGPAAVPLPIAPLLFRLRWVVAAYFCTAIGYDVIKTCILIFTGKE